MRAGDGTADVTEIAEQLDQPLQRAGGVARAAGVEGAEAGVDERNEAARIAPEPGARGAHRLLAEESTQAACEHLPDAVPRHVGEQHEQLVDRGVPLLAIAARVGGDISETSYGDEVTRSAALERE